MQYNFIRCWFRFDRNILSLQWTWVHCANVYKIAKNALRNSAYYET